MAFWKGHFSIQYRIGLATRPAMDLPTLTPVAPVATDPTSDSMSQSDWSRTDVPAAGEVVSSEEPQVMVKKTLFPLTILMRTSPVLGAMLLVGAR